MPTILIQKDAGTSVEPPDRYCRPARAAHHPSEQLVKRCASTYLHTADIQVRLYQMPRVNINPAAPGDNSDKLLLDDRFEVDRAPPFAPKADRGQPLQSRLATSYSHDGPVLDLSWCSVRLFYLSC
jgi:hypothetical protein